MMLESSRGALGRPRKPHGKRPLATILREHGALQPAHAVDVALDICDALATPHENGVVHGQLGLRCVRLTLTTSAGPRDVDIFTLSSEDDSDVAHQAAPFLAPEQRDLDRPVDARADLWSLGALLYTMLVGTAPTSAAVQPPVEGMPSALATIIEACMAADPASRPENVDDLAEKIASFATWPPDRFARIAERRERRAAAAKMRDRLERRGLGNMPSVLDKLDEAALARAQRDTTTTALTSVLHGSTTEAALQRLMKAAHEGTEAARVELASGLPALIDFDDEDEEVLPTSVDDEPLELTPVASPLTIAPSLPPELTEPLELPRTPFPSLLVLPSPSTSPSAPRARPWGAIVAAAALLAFAVGLAASRLMSTTTPTTVAPPPVEPAPTLTASTPAIPIFAPSSLPEVAPISPSSLPEVAPVSPSSLPEAKR